MVVPRLVANRSPHSMWKVWSKAWISFLLIIHQLWRCWQWLFHPHQARLAVAFWQWARTSRHVAKREPLIAPTNKTAHNLCWLPRLDSWWIPYALFLKTYWTKASDDLKKDNKYYIHLSVNLAPEHCSFLFPLYFQVKWLIEWNITLVQDLQWRQ